MSLFSLQFAEYTSQTTVFSILSTLSQTTNFYSSKLKEFVDDNFKFDKNGRKFSKWVENTVGKGEIANIKQCLLFLGVFKRLLLETGKNQGLFGKWLTTGKLKQK